MAARVARKQEGSATLAKVRQLRDSLRALVSERNRLHVQVRDQEAKIRQLQQRCIELDTKRGKARERIEHLLQQLPH